MLLPSHDLLRTLLFVHLKNTTCYVYVYQHQWYLHTRDEGLSWVRPTQMDCGQSGKAHTQISSAVRKSCCQGKRLQTEKKIIVALQPFLWMVVPPACIGAQARVHPTTSCCWSTWWLWSPGMMASQSEPQSLKFLYSVFLLPLILMYLDHMVYWHGLTTWMYAIAAMWLRRSKLLVGPQDLLINQELLVAYIKSWEPHLSCMHLEIGNASCHPNSVYRL